MTIKDQNHKKMFFSLMHSKQIVFYDYYDIRHYSKIFPR